MPLYNPIPDATTTTKGIVELAGDLANTATSPNVRRMTDTNGNELMLTSATGSAVNEVTLNNAATGGVPGFTASGNDSNIHVQFIGKGNGLTKVSVLRQDNTSNSYKHNSVLLTGWGIYAQGAASSKVETVTFGITFAQAPITMATYAGDNANVSTSYGSGGNNVKGPVCVKTIAQTTTSHDVRVNTADGTSWGATDNVFYTWMAVGEL